MNHLFLLSALDALLTGRQIIADPLPSFHECLTNTAKSTPTGDNVGRAAAADILSGILRKSLLGLESNPATVLAHHVSKCASRRPLRSLVGETNHRTGYRAKPTGFRSTHHHEQTASAPRDIERFSQQLAVCHETQTSTALGEALVSCFNLIAITISISVANFQIRPT